MNVICERDKMVANAVLAACIRNLHEIAMQQYQENMRVLADGTVKNATILENSISLNRDRILAEYFGSEDASL